MSIRRIRSSRSYQPMSTIGYTWNPSYPTITNDTYGTSYLPPHSATFTDISVPNVYFEFFAIVRRCNQFTMYLTKTPYDAANAILTISIDGIIVETINIKNWTNNRIASNIMLPKMFTELYGKSIRFDLTWGGFSQQASAMPFMNGAVPSHEQKVNSSSSINLYDYMKHFLGTCDLSDMVIMVKGEKILVHKIVLASQSSVFMAMFKSGLLESTSNQIDVEDIDIDIMKKVVEFLYSGKINSANLNIDEIISIVAVADKYSIMVLKNLCEKALLMRMTKNNALRIFEEANSYKLGKLIEAATILMMNNKQEISRSDEFRDLYNRKPDILFKYMTRIMEE